MAIGEVYMYMHVMRVENKVARKGESGWSWSWSQEAENLNDFLNALYMYM